jgi:hypothetical protein
MFRHAALIFSVIVLACSAGTAAQSRPDYTGDWVLRLDRSKLDERIGAGLERGTLRVRHTDSRFELRRVFARGGKDDASDFELMTDGTEKTSSEGPITRFSRLAWEEGILVLRERLAAPQGEATNTVHYRLLDGGRVLEARESFRGPRLQYDNVWVFERQAR